MEMRKGHDVGVVAALRQLMTCSSVMGCSENTALQKHQLCRRQAFLLTGRAVCSDMGFFIPYFISGGKFYLISRTVKAKLIGLVPFHDAQQRLNLM